MSTNHAFHRGLRNRVGFAAVAALALCTGCSTPDASSDETHFLCSADADCKELGDDRICEVHRCVQAPLGYPTSADGSPVLDLPASADVGPAGNCTRVLPDNAASFETSARRLPPTMASNWPGKSQEPVLSPNGHVILYGAATELEGPDEIVRGHLVRWVDDSLTWHGESEVGLILPRAVSCDGFTVMGHEANKSTARVFPRSVRWRPGAGYETLPDDRFAQAMAPEGDALYGVQLGTSNATAMEWRDGAEPRALLELPTMGGDTFWGRGAGAFAFHDAANLWFVKAGSGEPVSSRTHLPDECINVDNPMRLSAGGRLVTFDPECGRNEMAVYWETMPPPNVSPQFPPPIPISDFFGNVRAVANEFPDTAGYTAKVAVGVGFLGNGINRGVVWNLTISHRYLLEEMLEHYGVDVPPSVVITSVSDVSDDARVFTGTCIDERDPGRQNIFRAVLPAGAFEMPARSRNP